MRRVRTKQAVASRTSCSILCGGLTPATSSFSCVHRGPSASVLASSMAASSRLNSRSCLAALMAASMLPKGMLHPRGVWKELFAFVATCHSGSPGPAHHPQ